MRKIKTAEVFICAAGMAGTKSNIPIRFRDIKQATGNFTCFHVSLYQFKHVCFKALAVVLIYFKTHPIDLYNSHRVICSVLLCLLHVQDKKERQFLPPPRQVVFV